MARVVQPSSPTTLWPPELLADTSSKRTFLTPNRPGTYPGVLVTKGDRWFDITAPGVGPPPPPPPTYSEVGIDITRNLRTITIAQVYVETTTAYGTGLGGHTKWYGGSGAGFMVSKNALDGTNYGTKGEYSPVICGKMVPGAGFDADFNTCMTAMGSQPWVAVWGQEFNYGIKNGEYTMATFRSAYQSMDRLRAVHPNGKNVHICANADWYNAKDLVPAYSTFEACKGLVLDSIGYDTYATANYTPTQQNPTFFLQAAKDASAQLSAYIGYPIPWTIPEFGLHLYKLGVTTGGITDTYADLGPRLKIMIDWAFANGCLWFNYWEGQGNNGQWSLVGTDAQPFLSAAMQPMHP